MVPANPCMHITKPGANSFHLHLNPKPPWLNEEGSHNKMNPIRSVFFFFLVVSTTLCMVLAKQGIAANGSGNLVEQVCERTHNKQKCIESLQSNPDSKTANLPQLVIIALRLASANATDTSSFIKNSLTNQTLEPSVEQGLRDCAEYYQDAIGQLDDSIASLLAKATNDVRTWVKAAIADIESCEAASGVKPLLSKRNATLRQLCNNVLAINKLYSKQKN